LAAQRADRMVGAITMAPGFRYDVPGPASFERWRTPLGRFDVRWLREWTPEADEALAALPPMTNCPADLFRMLMTNATEGNKRCALVRRDGKPIALIGLRQRGRNRWQLITDREVCPRSWAPTAAGWLFPSLRALQSDIEINEWDRSLPAFARAATRHPLYRIDLRTDYRAFWHETRHDRRLRVAEGRTRRFAFEVDTEGIAAWTIRTWSERWGEQIAATDLCLAADYFFDRGRLHAFALIDDGLPCAGLTAFADGDDLVLLTTARQPAYEVQGVGTRVVELAIEWARAQGFKTVTFGSGRINSYKHWWAPPAGVAWTFRVRPAALELLKRGKSGINSARDRAANLVRTLGAARATT
jgi:GNAT superfamily N-acetyltransferase